MSDKLKKKIVKRIADGLNDYRPGGKPIEEIADKIIADVRKAGYTYAPPIYHKTKEVLEEVGNLHGVPVYSINRDENVMTGKEWYDRFIEELPYSKFWTADDWIDAAKRATGVDKGALHE